MGRPWMDFAILRERASFATVLARYAIVPTRLTGQVNVLCPFHDDRQPSLSVHLERKLFHCFACQARGDILDFVARLEQVTLPEAAHIVAECCALPPEERPIKRNDQQAADAAPHTDIPCQVLNLDPAHPYLRERGLTPELIETFGLGHCGSRRLAGRIAIPLPSPDGTALLGYAGRWAEDPVPDGIPRYLMPRGFRKSALLFNYHRVRDASHLVIVEGFWSVFRLHALGIPAVALMGTSLSDDQLALFRQSGVRELTLLLDADPAGRAATSKLLPQLAVSFPVRTPSLPEGQSPDNVPECLLLGVVQF